jgi:two-component system, OmpR family, response regulator
MLVLSRRPNEKILFPSINATVQIVSVKGVTVRLGIDAPPEVAILREELQNPAEMGRANLAPVASTEARLRELRHMVRNRLNVTSIGLALLRKQAKAGSSADLERTIGKMEEEVQLLGQRLATDAAKAPPQPAAKVRKALLVEDDQNERELLAGFLRWSGFEVDTAGDGCDALDHLHAGLRPDVVLLDMGLPRCDGATTAREIRRDPACANLKIFAVSGHSPDEYDVAQGPGGIDRWFSKPIDPVLLLRELT